MRVCVFDVDRPLTTDTDHCAWNERVQVSDAIICKSCDRSSHLTLLASVDQVDNLRSTSVHHCVTLSCFKVVFDGLESRRLTTTNRDLLYVWSWPCRSSQSNSTSSLSLIVFNSLDFSVTRHGESLVFRCCCPLKICSEINEVKVFNQRPQFPTQSTFKRSQRCIRSANDSSVLKFDKSFLNSEKQRLQNSFPENWSVKIGWNINNSALHWPIMLKFHMLLYYGYLGHKIVKTTSGQIEDSGRRQIVSL